MNDYLDSLLERAMREKPTIRPRLPAIFEPAAQVYNSPSEQSVDETTTPFVVTDGGLTNTEETPGAMVTQPGVNEKSALTAKEQSMQPLITTRITDPPVTVSGIPATGEHQPDVQAHLPAQAGLKIHPKVHSFEPSATMQKDLNLTGADTYLPSMEIEFPQPAIQTAFTNPAPEPTPERTNLAESSHHADGDEDREYRATSADGTTLLPSATPLAALPPKLVPRRNEELILPAPIRLERADAENAPDIQTPPRVTIHIGRIEIRTARQPATAPSRKPSAGQRKPVMSLDSYLKQRSGEKP